LQIHRLAVATSRLLISGVDFLAARSEIGVESTHCGD
jgi:hypothetical protein